MTKMAINPFNGPHRITSKFGPRIHPVYGEKRWHNGVDFAAVTGTPLHAVEDGIIRVSKCNRGGVKTGYGYYLVVEHDQYCTVYGHLEKLGLQAGTRVKKGQIIGYSGNTGATTGPHLHFEVRSGKYVLGFWERDENGKYQNALDPETFVPTPKPLPKWQRILHDKVDSPDAWIEYINSHKHDTDISRFLPQLIEKIAK